MQKTLQLSKIDLETTSSGHYIIPLRQSQETILMTLDMKGKSVRDKNKTAKKLHQQFGHRTYDKILQLVKTAGVEDSEFQDQLKKVAENCKMVNFRIR